MHNSPLLKQPHHPLPIPPPPNATTTSIPPRPLSRSPQVLILPTHINIHPDHHPHQSTHAQNPRDDLLAENFATQTLDGTALPFLGEVRPGYCVAGVVDGLAVRSRRLRAGWCLRPRRVVRVPGLGEGVVKVLLLLLLWRVEVDVIWVERVRGHGLLRVRHVCVCVCVGRRRRWLLLGPGAGAEGRPVTGG